jgi:hypothetical protein
MMEMSKSDDCAHGEHDLKSVIIHHDDVEVVSKEGKSEVRSFGEEHLLVCSRCGAVHDRHITWNSV